MRTHARAKNWCATELLHIGFHKPYLCDFARHDMALVAPAQARRQVEDEEGNDCSSSNSMPLRHISYVNAISHCLWLQRVCRGGAAATRSPRSSTRGVNSSDCLCTIFPHRFLKHTYTV